MSVRVLQGESPDVVFEQETVALIDQTTDCFSITETYGNAMMWYAKLQTKTGEYIQGIWSCGKGDISSQFGVALLLDTSSLGLVRNIDTKGNSMYLIHGGDGSVSRLGNYLTGTYDTPATIETLIYGADSPYQKELSGVSIVTENLPTGGSVVAYYRTDSDDSWVALGTSNTVGTRRHSFTRVAGVPIGKFQEIEFKFVITGKVTVKNIRVDLVETDNLPY
jgi:hypothetical protein